jgi:hypothetical protein
MHDPTFVGRLKSRGRIPRHPDCGWDIEHAVLDTLGQGRAFDVLKDKRYGAVDFFDSVDRGDRRMTNRGK